MSMANTLAVDAKTVIPEYCISMSIGTFFFFSSRRRHTRSLRDWSSDVCSSDLIFRGVLARSAQLGEDLGQREPELVRGARSEERRVGKECRARGAPYH